jgi:hypothetical protein
MRVVQVRIDSTTGVLDRLIALVRSLKEGLRE